MTRTVLDLSCEELTAGCLRCEYGRQVVGETDDNAEPCLAVASVLLCLDEQQRQYRLCEEHFQQLLNEFFQPASAMVPEETSGQGPLSPHETADVSSRAVQGRAAAGDTPGRLAQGGTPPSAPRLSRPGNSFRKARFGR